MALPTHVATSRAQRSGSYVDVPRPTGQVAGDLVLVTVMSRRGSSLPGTITAADGAWTEVHATTGSAFGTHYRWATFRKTATASEPATYRFTSSNATLTDATASAYRTVDADQPIHVQASGLNTIDAANGVYSLNSITPTEPVLDVAIILLGTANGFTTSPEGFTQRYANLAEGWLTGWFDRDVLEPGATGTAEFTAGLSLLSYALRLGLVSGHLPPDAPTNLTPDGVTVDRTTTQRLAWQFNDPNPGDQQSQAEVRWRQGTGAWTTTTVGTTQWADVPGGTWADGQVEWQVRTRDNAGEWGPFSSSVFFTASTPPPGSTITSPTNGGTISAEQWLVTWTVGDQDAYQLRVLDASDDSVLYDTGTVESSGARSRLVDFPTNGVDVKVQHRARTGGLWQLEWSTVTATVDWTAPAAPTVTVAIHHEWDPIAQRSQPAAIAMYATHPTPEGDQPQVVAVDWWRRRELLDHAGQHVGWDPAEGGEAGIPLARGHQRPVSAVFVDWQVAHGQPYAYRARAHGDNETSSWSEWTAAEGEITFPYGGTYDVDA